jgi:hypothetical protein
MRERTFGAGEVCTWNGTPMVSDVKPICRLSD